MAQISRKGGMVFLRDDEGKHTAITFRNAQTEWIWISNQAIRTICVSAVLVTAIMTGTVEKGLAVPDKLVTWALKGSLK